MRLMHSFRQPLASMTSRATPQPSFSRSSPWVETPTPPELDCLWPRFLRAIVLRFASLVVSDNLTGDIVVKCACRHSFLFACRCEI